MIRAVRAVLIGLKNNGLSKYEKQSVGMSVGRRIYWVGARYTANQTSYRSPVITEQSLG